MMVSDPKLAHGDYGSFHTTQASSSADEHNMLGDRHLHRQRPSDCCSPHAASDVESGSMLMQDLYQREPLLPPRCKEPCDPNDDLISANEECALDGRNGMVKIDLPPPLRDEPRFPKEKGKTLVAFIFLNFSFILTATSLALTHEKVPNRETYGPLPDVVLDHAETVDWALDISESLIMIAGISCLIVLIFHKHRYIILRRVFLLLGLLYLMRSVTMFVTVLPMASRTYHCSPKANTTDALLITRRVIQLVSGMGLSINGKHTYCGDYIYSGHTVMLVMAYLIIQEYTPRRLFVLHWVAWMCAVTGIVGVLISRGHYTIDVLIAYYVTTRLFWMYHTMANNTVLKQAAPGNYLSRLWWYPVFRYFERNVAGSVPRQYEWPLPWPRRCFAKPPNRDS